MRLSFPFAAGTALLFGCAAMCGAAPPKVDYFFPPGAPQGQSATVAVAGGISNWPLQAWVDREGLTVEAGEKKGELKLTAAADAAGTYWLRLFDEEGASSPRPFVVGGIGESTENETNDDPHKPQVLEGAATINGKLAKRGDVDTFAIELKSGQTLVASLLANNLLNSPMDGVLQICDREGFVLAQNDDGRGLDPLLVYLAPRDGTYLVRTFAFPAEPNSSIAFAGAENFVYRLTVATGPFVDYTLPLAARGDESTDLRLCGWNLASESLAVAAPGLDRESIFVLAPQSAAAVELPIVAHSLVVAAPENSPAAPQNVELPVCISGVIESPKDIDSFRFAANKGEKISLRVESRALGFEMDPLVQVTDANGKVLTEADDAGRNERDPAVTFTAPADGEFHAQVRDLHFQGGPRHAYRLMLEEEKPDYRFTLAADSFTLTPGKPLEIAVTVDRRNGFDGEIEIAARDLPAGVTAAPVKSLAKGDTAKSVKLTLTADAGPASAPFTIAGSSGEDQEQVRYAAFSIAGSKSAHREPWLTVMKSN